MIGRERELDELTTTISTALDGHGGLLMLAGEAGVGKTRLAEAAIAQGESRLPAKRSRRAGLVAVCADHGGASRLPPRAARRALQRGTDRRAPSPAAARARTCSAQHGSRDSFRSDSRRVRDDRGARGDRRVPRRPPVGGRGDARVLPLLAEAAEEWPLLLLGAYRNESIPRGHPLRRLRTDLRRAGRLVELDVEPLDAAATAELAGRLLDGDPGPALRAALYDRTQGIPFFVEELAAALKRGGRLTGGQHGLSSRKGRACRYRRRSATRCASGQRVCRTRDERPSRQRQSSESRSTSMSWPRSSATQGSARSSTAGCSTRSSPGLRRSGTT